MQPQNRAISKQVRASIDTVYRDADFNSCKEEGFPYERWKTIARTGIFKHAANPGVSKQESILSTVYGLEHLGEVCKDSGLLFSVVTHLASTITALYKFGSSELKGRVMEDLIAGRLIGAHAISEPEAGSDALSMTTTAYQAGDDYIINGHKAFVTNGSVADVIVVYAKTSDAATADCVSAFLVDTHAEGVHIGPTIEKVGLSTSPLCELTLKNCRVPKTNMIGRLGAGFFVLSHVMQREILYSFMVSIGEMKRRLLRCVNYANSRNQFGSPIGSYQSVSNRIADMKIRYELSRQWLYHIAERMIANKDITSEIAIAKVFVSENALATSIDALHIHGGYGYVASNGLGEEVCNALAGPIYSGTNDIQRGRIASLLGVSTQSKPRLNVEEANLNRFKTIEHLEQGNMPQHNVECASSDLLDFEHEGVRNFVDSALGGMKLNERETAIKLYYAVRDNIAYEVFSTDISESGLRASSIVKARKGFCLHKAILYAAACRSQGISCQIVANRVCNHISTPELQNLVGGKEFLHWYNEVKIDGVWLKVSPVFNKLLCKLYGLEPLEFDGYTNAIAQPYSDNSAMNYLDSPEVFMTPNYHDLIALVQTYHPKMVTNDRIIPRTLRKREIMQGSY